MKSTVVIGGSGFIGTNLIPYLISSGRHVTVIDKYKNNQSAIMDVEFIEQDCKDIEIIAPLVKKAQEIVYLAYSSTPATSQQNENIEWEINVKPVVGLLKKFTSRSLEKFIFISSGGAIYGNAKTSPIPETTPTQPISDYGKSKLDIEKEGLKFYKECGLPFVSLRPSNAFGPGQIPFKGQGLVATAFGCVCKNLNLCIYGRDVIRDYVYVDDLSKAIVLALETAKAGEVYNIGTGQGTSNIEVISKIQNLIADEECELKFKIDNLRDFDPISNVLDSSKFSAVSDWKPSTTFEQGLKNTWEWIKNYYGK